MYNTAVVYRTSSAEINGMCEFTVIICAKFKVQATLSQIQSEERNSSVYPPKPHPLVKFGHSRLQKLKMATVKVLNLKLQTNG